MNPKISIVLVNWNGIRLIDPCLNAIFQQTYRDFEVVFVDNASTDGSEEHVREHFKAVRVVQTGSNLGFAEGMNRGIEASRGEWIFSLGNDTVIDENCLVELLKAVEGKPRVGMVCATVLLIDGSVDTYGLKIYPSGMPVDIKERGVQPLCPCGAGGLYRRKMLDEVKVNGEYYDKDFFMFCEDLDLGLRCRLKGWKCVSAYEAIVHHHHGATIKQSESRIVYGIRNRLWVVQKDFPRSVINANILLILGFQLAVVVKYFFKPRLWWQGFSQAWAKRHLMYGKRLKIQRGRAITKKDFRKLLG
ncbi:MAG: glycosyltransferase family 2 protein [Nanoarchaeota archaeon]